MPTHKAVVMRHKIDVAADTPVFRTVLVADVLIWHIKPRVHLVHPGYILGDTLALIDP
jgi:hypothetical protein